MSAPATAFLTLDDVLRLHKFAIEDQGGDPAILNAGLLDAALAMPQHQFGGMYLHPDIPSMAAAYAFHICKNHPFADGNKRAAFATMVAFLVINGWVLNATNDEVEQTILTLASGQMSKEALTAWVTDRAHARGTTT